MKRYKKGGKVEVLSTKDVLPTYWRCAEIVCSHGHKYTVKYDGYEDSAEERVSRKAIRPCPPEVEGLEWVPGDIVEVFDDFAWKMAAISKVLGGKCVLVRLLGSLLEFKVSILDIRLRQSWQYDKWVVIGKGPLSAKDSKQNEVRSLRFKLNSCSRIEKTNLRMNLCVNDDCFAVKNSINLPESHNVSSKTLKRDSTYCYTQSQVCEGTVKKLRVSEKVGRSCQAVAANTIPFCREVENNNVCDADSNFCSVGSCSINSYSEYKMPRLISTGPIEDKNDNISDAESYCQQEFVEGNCLLPSEQDLDAEIHRLELQAYHYTMEALHASGPLSWEQESLVTNLRLSLHISNDEHLMELRHLVSGDTRIAS